MPKMKKTTPTDPVNEFLEKGNRRFVKAALRHPRRSPRHRRLLTRGQRPQAAILCCADSRVVPEIIFDCGLGDLFAVRVAGAVADAAGIGSLEYAVEHLHVPLVLVLGHSRCGAVQAALAGEKAHGCLGSVLRAIQPAIRQAAGYASGDPLTQAIKANVRHTIATLLASSSLLSQSCRQGTLAIRGAYYDFHSGRVEPIDN